MVVEEGVVDLQIQHVNLQLFISIILASFSKQWGDGDGTKKWGDPPTISVSEAPTNGNTIGKYFKFSLHLIIAATHEPFIPEERSVNELFEEDIASSKFYKSVIEEDEDITVSGTNIKHILALK